MDAKNLNLLKEEKTQILLLAWDRLAKIQHFSCNAKSKECTRKGKALVSVTKKGTHVLIFHEKGTWFGKQEMNFNNIFRWTLDLNTGVISLEHLRYNSPVFLVNLTPLNNHLLISLQPHVCRKDMYTGKMHLKSDGVHLHWSIMGPKKSEEIDSYYFF
ncbi:MAG: hypothetical protein C5B45_02440 [Chlamydiae bacterium]|nr:MAG: hypothetical protein C5B45_02440 [Chlamydiota bacterium]